MEIGALKLAVDSTATYAAHSASSGPVAAVRVKDGTVGTDPADKDVVKAINPDDVHQKTAAMNQIVKMLNEDLHFAIHDKTVQLMVRVVDEKTQKVLKEFPPHEFLDMVARIREYVGMILDKKI